MKALTTLPLLALVFTLCTAGAFGTVKNNQRPTKAYTISTYVEAVTNGKIDALAGVVDKTARFCIRQGKTMMSYSKAQVMAHLTQLKNIKQACITTTTLVEDNSEVAVLRVDMQYENFTRSNYVTIALTGEGWKITNVCSVFK